MESQSALTPSTQQTDNSANWNWNRKQAKQNAIRISKKGHFALSTSHNKNFLIGNTQWNEGSYQCEFTIGNAHGLVPLVSFGLVDLENKDSFSSSGHLILSNTYGINSDGEIFTNRNAKKELEISKVSIE
jgi:hypothetical protein